MNALVKITSQRRMPKARVQESRRRRKAKRAETDVTVKAIRIVQKRWWRAVMVQKMREAA